MDNKEKRKFKRFEISEYVKDDNFKDIEIEINSDRIYRLKVIDINVNGIGYSIEETEALSGIDEFAKMTNYYINIIFSDKSILAEGKKVWSSITGGAGRRTLKGGLVFSIISPEDRLYIAKYINSLRS
ncbi:MAG: hypothetical protein V1874_03380 [Spirochaetota bacterium]